MTFGLVSLVVPVFNEESHLGELVRRCLAVGDGLGCPFELVLVDDGSRDRSRALIAEAAARHEGRVVGVLLNRNYGQHAAIMAGFAEARGDVVVTLDADLQNPPEEVPKLLARVAEGCDVVGSVRLARRDSGFRRLSSRIVNLAARRATGVDMRDYGCMLRAYRREVVDAMLQCHERSTFIPILANTFASRTGEVEVVHAERAGDESKYNIWKLINLQFDLLTSMTTTPLRIMTAIGALFAFLGIAFAVLLLALRLVYGAAWAGEGVFTIFGVLFAISGVQLLTVGLLGEYVGRIYHDVRARPRYFVQRTVGRGPAAPASRPEAAS